MLERHFMDVTSLQLVPALSQPDLLATPTLRSLQQLDATAVQVAPIDEQDSDTAVFCQKYQMSLADGANCVVVEARRNEHTWYAVCVALGSDRIDLNSTVRKHLGAKRVSLAAPDLAAELTGMQSGGMTPFGMPDSWPILIDTAVVDAPSLILGSGIRASKLLTDGATIAALPNTEIIDLTRHA